MVEQIEHKPRKSRKKEAKPTERHEKCIELINLGYSNKEICKQLSIKPNVLFYVKRRYGDRLSPPEAKANTINTNNYSDQIDNILKTNILKIGNTIAERSLEKCSVSQLATTFGIMYDKLRLHQGKSTSNVGANILLNINPDQLDMIKETIKSLKKSMLN